jgi:5'-3' exonuclease
MLVSIDGSFMLHRARFVAGKNGTPTRDHTVALFMKILIRTLVQFKPRRVYIYFDRERSYHRILLYPEYKGQRKEAEGDLTFVAYKEARAFLVDELPKLGIVTVLKDGVEADDFGYLTAHIYKAEKGVHVTDDRDWFTNLFPNWFLYRPKAKELVSYEEFCKKVLHAENPRMIFLIARAIVGDKSDNIQGIKGVTFDRALEIAPRILSREDLGDGRYAKKVREKMDQVYLNIKLMAPMWVLSSQEARATLLQAEDDVNHVHTNPFDNWKAFVAQLSPQVHYELSRLIFDYNHLVRGFVY